MGRIEYYQLRFGKTNPSSWPAYTFMYTGGRHLLGFTEVYGRVLKLLFGKVEDMRAEQIAGYIL